MDKQKDYLIRYVNYLEKKGMNITSDDMEAFSFVENNPEFKDIVGNLKNAGSRESRLNIIEKYIQEKEFEKRNEEEKLKAALEKKFGVDLTSIDHMKLQSGIDIIAFYDSKIGRKRLVDYSYAKSLVSEFTNIQNNSVNFQSDDEKANSNEIARQEADKYGNKRELDMIDIERVKVEYNDLIKRIKDMDPKKVQSVNELIRESERRKIKYINFENMVGLDEKGNIIESRYNEKKGQAELYSPDNYKNNVSTVNNNAQVDQAISDVENNETNIEDNATAVNQVDVNPTDFEQKEELVSAEEINLESEMKICNIQGTSKEVFDKIKKYSSDMSLLDRDLEQEKITKEEFDFYEMMCGKYTKQLYMNKARVKALEYNPSSDTRGIVSITIVSLLVMGLGFLMAILIS